jgi:hypothetical protein
MRSADEIRARVIGLGTGTPADLGGAAKPADVASARRVVAALEDRPFFGPLHMACEPEAALRTAADVGAIVRAEIDSEAISAGLRESLLAMTAALQKFNVYARGPVHTFGGFPSWAFHVAAGELRGTIGVHVARMAAVYGFDVEERLSAILPGVPDDGK